MRILIVGAGVAGLTLAALLRQRGIEPEIVERTRDPGDGGYMLGLYPLGGRVLHGLGLHAAYQEASRRMSCYAIRVGNSGDLLKAYDLSPLEAEYGALRGISRGALLELLRKTVGEDRIRYGTAPRALNHHSDHVEVTFSDGGRGDYDLVVGADGMHSAIRKMLLGPSGYRYWDTRWGGWLIWAGLERIESPDAYTEYWGAGFFAGVYPARDRIGIFLGGPLGEQRPDPAAFYAKLADSLGDANHPVLNLLGNQPPPADAFYWEFHDARCRQWHRGRAVLLGDAAAGFLPTAGIGASMAMESAAALNDELSRTDARFVTQALELYVKRHRPRVDAAQAESRRLSKLMFANSRPYAWLRDRLLRFYSLERLMRDIRKIMDEPI